MSTSQDHHGRPDHGHHDHGHQPSLWTRMRHVVVPHSHDVSQAILTAEEASGRGIRGAWIGLSGMGVTAGVPVAIVAISGSVALLADTVHNLGHLATTIPLIVAFQMGRRPTRRYSYGHRRAEDLVGLLIGLVIALSAALIIWESTAALKDPTEVSNLGWVFAAGIVGFVGNEAVAVYRIRTGQRIGSAALIAEGRHARADGLTSIAVVLSVVGVWAGLERADAIVGFIIALAILGILASTMRTIVRRLMDGVDDDLIDAMTATACAVPGVLGVDRVRARWAGHRMEADAAIRVAADHDVLTAHRITEEVEHRLLHAYRGLESVVIHVHPLVGADQEELLHKLSGHHASPEARERYGQRSLT